MDVKFLWGNSNFEFIYSEALGNSGGILCAWDNNVLCKEHHTISDNFIAVFGTWIPTKMKVMIISVYAPQADSYKRALWSYLELLVNRWNGESIIMGDFNEVRRKEERWGSTFNAHGARVFNNFISNAGLVDLQLEGFSFTWSHPSASKMSKLDRFLVTDGLISSFPHILAVCLDRHLSDHRPILLREGAFIKLDVAVYNLVRIPLDSDLFRLVNCSNWKESLLLLPYPSIGVLFVKEVKVSKIKVFPPLCMRWKYLIRLLLDIKLKVPLLRLFAVWSRGGGSFPTCAIKYIFWIGFCQILKIDGFWDITDGVLSA
ncbi:RNA-directed DNA polymerase, eukaryota [Tanacetum coccineum]|uniref:RNA-directed DNA polymerase, eukaryota n=1 Tax=Tanacetum coccineum TaxID=301880 RepID=A0ABQ5DM53_9ASTR